jgi:hypothetical protein
MKYRIGDKILFEYSEEGYTFVTAEKIIGFQNDKYICAWENAAAYSWYYVPEKNVIKKLK